MSLDKRVGQIQYFSCKKCGKRTKWVFCKETHLLSSPDYYWKCITCGTLRYVTS
jgi:uncharacterized Zn finger protein